MDLKEGWEKKALIGVVGAVLLIIIYAYFVPFSGTANNSSQPQVQVTKTPEVAMPYSQPITNNTNSNNSSSTNGTFLLTADQAKNIAINANPGYTAGQPTQGNLFINGSTVSTWIVPITKKNYPSKTVFVDASTGKIIQTT